MTKDEALKLALEALDSKYILGCGEWRGQQLKAITAIKEALAQPAQEPVAWISHNAGLYHFKPDESLDPLPLYLALPAAQPAQEIDWKDMYEKQKRRAEMWIAKYEKDIGQLVKAVPVAQPAQEQEPVADLDAWNLSSRLNEALKEIGDYAHDRSTGPVVPDALWEIRSMAYDAIEDATPPAAQPAQEKNT